MEQETLFTASKWDILKELRVKPRSPMELANLLNTSVANISQQMRLLEMAGLVESKRVSNREKGLPRVLYSLSGNHSYLIATAKEFVDKKHHKLTDRNKVVLRIWFLEDPSVHYYLEKAFWKIDEHLSPEVSLLYDQKSPDLKLAIVSDNKSELKKKIKDMEIENPDGYVKKIEFEFLEPQEIGEEDKERFYQLYDPQSILNGNDSDDTEDEERDNGDDK